MRRAIFAAVWLALPCVATAADDALKASGAAMIAAEQRLEKVVRFDPSLAPISIFTARSLAREPKLPAAEPRYQEFFSAAGVQMAYALDVKLKADDEDYLVVRCNSGGSNDPECVFSASQDPAQPGVAIPGSVFVIPGDGCVYSGGHTNRMFGTRALSCVSAGVLKPRAQPFAYAGFPSKALRQLTLYGDQNETAVVTTIPAGGFVEVVLQDADSFLLRDRFGLTGWAKLEQKSEPTEIEGFYYNGD
jgi:hypothetical protein